MKKILLIMAAMAAVLSGCNKTEVEGNARTLIL